MLQYVTNAPEDPFNWPLTPGYDLEDVHGILVLQMT